MTLKEQLIEIERKVQLVKDLTSALHKSSNVPYPNYFWGEFKGVTQEGAYCHDIDDDEGTIPLNWLEKSDEELKSIVVADFERRKVEQEALLLKRQSDQRNQRLLTYRQLKIEFKDID